MKLSARNLLAGKVVEIDKGEVMAKVKLKLADGQTISALISVEAVEDLDLEVGEEATAIIKATEVMIGK